MVDLREFETHLQSVIPDLYSFSYALIPDVLQAQQVVIDAISAIVLTKSEFFEQGLLEDQDEEIFLKNVKVDLLQCIFSLSKKRIDQISDGIDEEPFDSDEFAPFYSLDLLSRAIIFLSEVGNFSLQDISEVIKRPFHEVISQRAFAQNELQQMAMV